MDKFNPEATQALADKISETVSEAKLSVVESTYALASVLEALGKYIYDRYDTSDEAVEQDYYNSPTYGAALMIHARQIHKIYAMFAQERKAHLDTKQDA